MNKVDTFTWFHQVGEIDADCIYSLSVVIFEKKEIDIFEKKSKDKHRNFYL
jgi:hypothetical protein